MQAINKITRFFFVFFHACFAGILLGQVINLFGYKEPGIWVMYGAAGLVVASVVLLSLFKNQIQFYLFTHFGFQWIHFFSSILYGLTLLLFLLPVLFNFDEGFLIVSFIQISSLLAFIIVVVETYILRLDLLLKVYADLLQIPKSDAKFSYLIWLVTLALFAYLSIFLYQAGGNTLYEPLRITLYLGTILFFLLLGVKFLVSNILSSLQRYLKWDDIRIKEDASPLILAESNYYFLEDNLTKVLLETSAEDRSVLYAKIRQIPLIDKIQELEHIREQYLPNEDELNYTLLFLQKLQKHLADQGDQYDIDTLTDVLEIKAYIRVVIAEGNPMLVQKLLNDNRPEVKKAAIFATVYFREPSLIPALVNFLKDPEFAFSAKEALFKIGPVCLPYLRSAKYRNKDNSFFVEHYLKLVQSYRCNESRDFLVEMLNEPQKRFRYKAALALLQNGYPLTVIHKNQILHFIESLIGTIAVLREIHCEIKEENDLLVMALAEEENEKMGLAIDLLEAFLPRPVLSLVKDLMNKDGHNNAFSLFALIDLFFPLVHQAKFKILLGNDEKANIAPDLQAEYLNEQINFKHAGQHEAMKQILKMDFSQIGYWLRVCALQQLAKMPAQQISLPILAEVFNANTLLQEVASEVLYDLNFDYYFLYMQRLHSDRAKELKHKIETHKILMNKGREADSKLLYHQILFLSSIPLFQDYPFESLARNIHLFSFITFEGLRKELNFDPYKLNGYWIVKQGEFTILHLGEQLIHGRRGDIIDMSFLTETEKHTVSLHPKNENLLMQDFFNNSEKSQGIHADRDEKTPIPEEIQICFIEYYTLNKLFLETRKFKDHVLQPKLSVRSELVWQ